MALLGKIARDALGGAMPGAAIGAGAGAMMSPEGSPAFQTADNAAMGMGAGALAGMAAGGMGAGQGIKRIAQQLFSMLKREKPQMSDMEAWAMAERQAHDLAMSQRMPNPPSSAAPPLALK